MLTNLELDGEIGVIHARCAKVGFGGCSPLFF